MTTREDIMPEAPSAEQQKLMADMVEAIHREIEPLQPASTYPARRRYFDPPPKDFNTDFLFGLGRDKYWAKYGYVLLSKECVEALADLLRGKSVLDVGSGGGFLSHALAAQGVSTVALEVFPPGLEPTEQDWRTFWKVDLVEDVRKVDVTAYDALILSWPEHGSPLAFEVASAMKSGQMLVYQGEIGGCTADDNFFEYLRNEAWEHLEIESAALNKDHVQFHGINDAWYVFKKLS